MTNIVIKLVIRLKLMESGIAIGKSIYEVIFKYSNHILVQYSLW
jgi:hypothetical protein